MQRVSIVFVMISVLFGLSEAVDVNITIGSENATSAPTMSDTINMTYSPTMDSDFNYTEAPTYAEDDVNITLPPTSTFVPTTEAPTMVAWESNATDSPTYSPTESSSLSPTISPSTLMPTMAPTDVDCVLDEAFARAFVNYAQAISDCEELLRCESMTELIDLTVSASKSKSGYFSFEVLEKCSVLDILVALEATGDKDASNTLFQEDCIDADPLSFIFQGKQCMKTLNSLRVKDLMKTFGGNLCHFEARLCFTTLNQFYQIVR